MYSQKAVKNADACRFCWMCRHLCPVQLVTGKEANTPRAKGLLVSMERRGQEKMDEDEAEVMYDCLLCEACTNDCATGYDPLIFIREGRTEAQTVLPEYLKKTMENLENRASVYEEAPKSYEENDINAEILVYIGDVARHEPATEVAEHYLSILKKAGVSFKTLKEEPVSGQMVGDFFGYVDEVKDIAKKCANAINSSNVRTVIVLDSYDRDIMVRKYPEWGIDIKAELVSGEAFLANLVEQGKIIVKDRAGETVTYHDDDRNARSFKEYEPARELIAAIGYNLKEMFLSKELSKSFGTVLYQAYRPDIEKKIVANRIVDAERAKVKTILTSNPQVYAVTRHGVKEGYEVKNLYALLDE